MITEKMVNETSGTDISSNLLKGVPRKREFCYYFLLIAKNVEGTALWYNSK